MAESHLNTSDEIWKDIPEFPGYQVSDQGRVRSFWKRAGWGKGTFLVSVAQRILRPGMVQGYQEVNLWKDGKPTNSRVHRLVLSAFVGPCPPNLECCHNDGNRSNNSLLNLRWDTRKENMRDSVKHGTHGGLDHHPAKLNETQVIYIRELYATKGHTMRGLARIFGVCQGTISTIVHRRKWKHI